MSLRILAALCLLATLPSTLPLASADDNCGDGNVECDCPPGHAANCAQPYIYCDGEKVYNRSTCPENEPQQEGSAKDDDDLVVIIVKLVVGRGYRIG